MLKVMIDNGLGAMVAKMRMARRKRAEFLQPDRKRWHGAGLRPYRPEHLVYINCRLVKL